MNAPILIYGYGNPGRMDDRLGHALVEQLEAWCQENDIHDIHFKTSIQLNVEDAEVISKYDRVLFIDASQSAHLPVIQELSPDPSKVEFTMHTVSPAYLLSLSHDLFGKQPKACMLHLPGTDWEIGDDFSDVGEKSLKRGYGLAVSWVEALVVV